MGAYHYIAITRIGQEQKGVIEADSEKQAREQLRQQSLIPIQIQAVQTNAVSQTLKQSLQFLRLRSLSSKELALITRQFATLLSSGLPLEETLLAVSEHAEKHRVKALILSVRAKILEGHAFASALSNHPDAFSPLFCAMVASGEKSGHLDKVLLLLAEYTEQQWQMKQKLKTALIYPAMIILTAISIVGFLLEYVVPKMVAVYAHLDQALPILTVILISLSDGVRNYGLFILIILIISMVAFRLAIKKNKSFCTKVHFFLLRLPFIGNVIKTTNTARFARTLSILTASGVSVLEAMRISAQLITTIPIQSAVLQAEERVREGAAIHLALKQTTYFSPMSLHMIASGEASGQLEAMLERVARNQEDDISRLIEVSMSLFEPAIILIMGVIVLFIVLAVLLPIFDLNQFS